MANAPDNGMQHRKGLINGGPVKKNSIDEEEVSKSIDRLAYIGFAAAGMVLGGILALYLAGYF